MVQKLATRNWTSDFKLTDINKKRPERYETVRAFGLSVYVASLSSVSRYVV